MKSEERLKNRSNNTCELCASGASLNVYEIPPAASSIRDNHILICDKCEAQIEKREELDSRHWRILSETMWNEHPEVQVVAWRMLHRLSKESWAADNLDLLYLDETYLEWAKATGDHENDATVDLHKDSNGHILQQGDTVILIRSLDVKGSTLNAKMGTVVKNIKLVADHTEQIEGKIEGQTIVILTKYVKKQGV